MVRSMSAAHICLANGRPLLVLVLFSHCEEGLCSRLIAKEFNHERVVEIMDFSRPQITEEEIVEVIQHVLHERILELVVVHT